MRKRLTGVLAVLTLVGLSLFGTAAPAHADGEVYMLMNAAGQNCLDVRNGGTDNFDAVDVYHCYYNGGTVEEWALISVPKMHAYVLQNVNSKKCLDVQYGSMAPFAVVDQYDCYKGPAELWYLSSYGSTSYHVLTNYQSGLDLDDYFGGTNDFNQVDQYYPVEGDPAELWMMRQV